MKKITLILVLSLAVSTVFAQNSAVNKALTNQKNGNLDEAKAQIDLAIAHEKTKGKSKTWYTKGLIYEDIATANGDDKALMEAIEAYRKTKTLDKETGVNYIFSDQRIQGIWGKLINDGATAYQEDRYEDAVKAFTTSQMVNPEDTTGYIYAAAAAQSGEDYTTAMVNYKKLLATGYSKADIYQSMVYIERAQNKDNDAALELVREAREKFPDNSDLAKEEINLLILTEKVDEAKEKLGSAIEAEPENSILYYNLAFLNDQVGDKDAAIANYQKAIDHKPDYFEANYNLAVLHYNKAADIFKTANNMDLKTYQREGKKLEASANVYLEEALPYLEKASTLQANDLSVWETLQTVYSRLKMNDKAEMAYNKIQELDSGEDEN